MSFSFGPALSYADRYADLISEAHRLGWPVSFVTYVEPIHAISSSPNTIHIGYWMGALDTITMAGRKSRPFNV
jgi:hypothetical protein